MASDIIVISDDEDELSLGRWPSSKHLKKRSLEYVSDDEDDIVVIEKLPCLGNMKTDKKEKITSIKENKASPDDDCCVLNYDPDNTPTVSDYTANDSDDLVVIRERGPVACRDFPHARHLCAKFPFKTTSHEKYCEQCHCYVCDVKAPCLLWGQGKQSNDHCHAIDKDEKWKLMREQARSAPPKLPTRGWSQSRTIFQTQSGPNEKSVRPDRSTHLIYSNPNPHLIDDWLSVNTTMYASPPISAAVLPRPYVPSTVTSLAPQDPYVNFQSSSISNVDDIYGDRTRASSQTSRIASNDRQYRNHIQPYNNNPAPGLPLVPQTSNTGIQQSHQSQRTSGAVEEIRVPLMPTYRVATFPADKNLQTIRDFHSYVYGDITDQNQGQVMTNGSNNYLQAGRQTSGNEGLTSAEEQDCAVPSAVPESHNQQVGVVTSSIIAPQVALQNCMNAIDTPGLNNLINGIDSSYSLDDLLATFDGDEEYQWTSVPGI